MRHTLQQKTIGSGPISEERFLRSAIAELLQGRLWSAQTPRATAPREVAMPMKRASFAARRKAVGFSQDQLAERLKVDRSTVVRWESGETEPQPWLRPRLAKALQVSFEQLNELLVEASAVVADGDTERLDYTLTHPGSADLVTVAQLRREVQQLDQQYVSVPSASLLADAGQALGQVRFLAANAASLRVRRELSAVEAEAAILMGQLVWDASQRRDHASARRYFNQAVAAGRQVRDPAAEGLALLRMAMIALYGEGDPRAGLALAEQAAETTEHVSDVIAGLTWLHAAEAHAMLGDRRRCESALATADTTLTRVNGMDRAFELYSATQFGRMAGSCYLSLADTRRAVSVLEDTAAALGDGSKSQAVVLGNLALALIRQEDLDEAAGWMHEAMDVIERNWGGGGLNIIFDAGRELLPWRNVQVVQGVHDRLLMLMAG
jgi:transcriptional regulator with XRE-family HTH domain